MQKVTLFRRDDQSVGMVKWADREHPTEDEKKPNGARKVFYSTLPFSLLAQFRMLTEDQVAEILMRKMPQQKMPQRMIPQ